MDLPVVRCVLDHLENPADPVALQNLVFQLGRQVLVVLLFPHHLGYQLHREHQLLLVDLIHREDPSRRSGPQDQQLQQRPLVPGFLYHPELLVRRAVRGFHLFRAHQYFPAYP